MLFYFFWYMYINVSGDLKFICEFNKIFFWSMFYYIVGIISFCNLLSVNSVMSVC